METGYSSWYGGGLELGQQVFIKTQLNILRYIITAENYINSHKIKIGVWYDLIGGKDDILWNPEKNFGILKDDWDKEEFKWTKKAGYNDLKSMIGKF